MISNVRQAGIRKHLLAGLCLPALLLPGCGTLLHDEPDWIRNPKTVYPEAEYLVAVGEGDTRRAAENTAAANLSRIFEAHIESDERLLDTVSETSQEFIRTTDLTTDINILSSQTLINIQHAETWKDGTGRYHAVAYLHRRDTAVIYRDQVNEQTERVQALLEDAAETDQPLEKYANLRAAVQAATENELLLRQLRVIHPSAAAAAKPPYSLHAIQRAATESARRIRVDIRIEGDTEGRIADCLKDLVTRYGFVVGTPAVLNINGQVSVTDTGERTAGLAFFRYMLSVKITDNQGSILAAVNERGREAVTSPDAARTRCYRTMENAIQAEGSHRLDLFFDSLVEHVH